MLNVYIIVAGVVMLYIYILVRIEYLTSNIIELGYSLNYMCV